MWYDYWVWDAGTIPSEICDEWVARYDSDLHVGCIDGNDVKDGDNKIRRSRVKFVDDADVKSTIFKFAMNANRETYGVDITSFTEVQFTKYLSEEKGFYDWHIDTDFKNLNGNHVFQRKLSVVILLSDPNDFEGGELWVQKTADRPVPLGKGSVVVFPGLFYHRVTPVTKGSRYTMVGWVEGPAWR